MDNIADGFIVYRVVQVGSGNMPRMVTDNSEHSEWITCSLGLRGGAAGSGTALRVGRSRVRFPMVSMEIFIDIKLPAALWPW